MRAGGMRRILWGVVILGCIAVGGAARAEDAADAVILTLDGALADGAGPVRFTLGDLEAVGVSRLITSTPWDKAPVVFSGVRLSDLLRHVRATGTVLKVVALNDFAAALPLSDVRSYEPLLATRRDGEPLAVRNKGPLFVVYPFDAHPDLRNEVIRARSVWQVKSITVE